MNWQIAAVIAMLALIIYSTRKSASMAGDRIAKTAPPKGWISDDEVSLADALDVADRHLITARSGSNVRLQYGYGGCLTLLRRVSRRRETGYVARWEFWESNPELEAAMKAVRSGELKTPKPEVLELWFDGDYVAFKRTVEALFETLDPVEGNTHLTWNC